MSRSSVGGGVGHHSCARRTPVRRAAGVLAIDEPNTITMPRIPSRDSRTVATALPISEATGTAASQPTRPPPVASTSTPSRSPGSPAAMCQSPAAETKIISHPAQTREIRSGSSGTQNRYTLYPRMNTASSGASAPSPPTTAMPATRPTGPSANPQTTIRVTMPRTSQPRARPSRSSRSAGLTSGDGSGSSARTPPPTRCPSPSHQRASQFPLGAGGESSTTSFVLRVGSAGGAFARRAESAAFGRARPPLAPDPRIAMAAA